MNKEHLYKYISFLLAVQLMMNVLWADAFVCLTDCSKQDVIELLNSFDGESKDEKEKDEKDESEKTRYEYHFTEVEHTALTNNINHELEFIYSYHPEITTPPPKFS